MSKVLKVAAAVAGVVAIVASAGSLALFGSVVGATVFGVGVGTITAVAGGLALASSLLSPKPKPPAASPADRDRLFANIDPRTPRKIVYGRTAMATDIRDQEFTGTDDEYFHRFLVVASHKVNSIEEIWFDDKLAWTSAGGVQGDYVGYLTVAPILEGTAANAINISSRMGSTRRFTGLAYVHFRYKLTGNDKKSTSPFAQAVPTRVTIIGNAMELYDPRLDSTRGGSGSHRIDDQSTWTWDDDACRNPPLQLLNYLIGYKINDKIAVGKGIPPARIDIQSFATAANACDEAISLAAGGSEPRYRTDGIFSEADALELVLNQYKSSMNAITDDAVGKIRVIVLANDLASPTADFDENDVMTAVEWKPNVDLGDRFNIVRGTHTDPSDEALYQAVDYPEQSLTSPDGIDRILPIDYPMVESSSQCERLAKQRLQRAQFGGMMIFTGGERYQQLVKNDIIRQTFAPLGMTNKLFRVAEISVRQNGTVPLILREEDASIYAWDEDETAAVVAAAPDTYDYTKNPLYQDIVEIDAEVTQAIADAASAQSTADGKIDSFYQPSVPTGDLGDLWFKTDTSKWYIARADGSDQITTGEWELTEDADIGVAITNAADAQSTADGKVTTFYASSTPIAEATGDLWYNTDTLKLSRWSGSAWVEIDNGATRNEDQQNLIPNAVTYEGYYSNNAKIYLEELTPTDGPLKHSRRVRSDGNSTAQSFYISGDATGGGFIPVVGGEKLYRSFDANRSSADGDIWLLCGFYAADGTLVSNLFGVNPNGATNLAWLSYSDEITVPDNAAFMLVRFYANDNNTTGTWRLANPYVGRAQLGSDVTADAVPYHGDVEGNFDFTANHLGVLDGDPLPSTNRIRRFKGLTDVSMDSVWSINNQGGVTGGTVTVSNGVVTIPTGCTIPKSGKIEVQSVRDNFTLKSTMEVTRTDAPAPQANSGGGTGDSDSTLGNITTASLVAVSDVMEFDTGSAGEAQFSGDLSIIAAQAANAGDFGARLQWRVATTSGALTGAGANSGAEISETQKTLIEYDSETNSYFLNLQGTIDAARLDTSLAVDTTYFAQLWARRDSATPAKNVGLGGSVAVQGS